ncbi:hypothetical protein TEA_010653 [Camellia sinensis var. sinensis]|uniref:Nucleolar 27S pre-rRNA processing Urb2/Npa2 C-terminal domain-containing protein n=1 Tax=Camellia sinensis var. sinensis TaxID=542762 RepID=A0A4S4D8S1_CAMSN|nr:hypothetical protein TEA_010653 [Camellia sinensis var. sinensis]
MSWYVVCVEDGYGKTWSSLAAIVKAEKSLIMEEGRKRLSVVKRHIQSLVACLFNIILHLQGPLIFYTNIISNKGNADPDPGSVILMCVEVLTRVLGKHAMYQLDSCQVGQSLRIPAALFQNFFQLRISEAPAVPNSLRLLDNQDTDIVEGMNSCVVDRQFSIDLFAACCRLLCTVLKHHKNETEQCVALLEDSVSVLLHCLEMVDTSTVVGESYFAWKVQEAVKCASFLRRIYEELWNKLQLTAIHGTSPTNKLALGLEFTGYLPCGWFLLMQNANIVLLLQSQRIAPWLISFRVVGLACEPRLFRPSAAINVCTSFGLPISFHVEKSNTFMDGVVTMRQQKDVFGRHCSLFLSSYIWTYSGYGPLNTGIRREIDTALRPGIYALIDACSADDLQHLHTVFEACRVVPFLLCQEMTERKEILSLKKDLLVFISSRIEAAQDLPVLLNFWTKKRLVNLAVFHFTTIWMPGLNYSISYMY